MNTIKIFSLTTFGVLLISPVVHGELILSDLQRVYYAPDGYPAPVVQNTQAGWFAQTAIRDTGLLNMSLTPTASGTAAGIGATMVSTVKWESRGGDQYPDERQLVSGTSFDAVVSDFWVTRVNNFDLVFSGLSIGTTYRVRTWHNDSYAINEGFAAGGGTITTGLSGATLVSKANGTVTHLSGAQSSSAFGITDLTFIATVANPTVTYTRTGGSITAIPVNGVEFTSTAGAAVPEPGTWAAAAMLAGGAAFMRWRKRAKVS